MIKIPKEVYKGLESVRLSGLTNMLDRSKVIIIAEKMGYEETGTWIRSHKQEYSMGIFQGFQVE